MLSHPNALSLSNAQKGNCWWVVNSKCIRFGILTSPKITVNINKVHLYSEDLGIHSQRHL